MTSEVELRLLRAFRAVADELHIGRAAEVLHVSQPTLSRQMQALESQIGTPLFLRTPHGVALTESGAELRIESDLLLAQAAHAVNRTRRAGSGDLGQLSVGFIGSALDLVVDLLTRMRHRHPAVSIHLTERPYMEQAAGIQVHEDDVAFVRDETPTDAVAVFDLAQEPTCLVIPSTHALAGRSRITHQELVALAAERFLTTRRWMALRGISPRRLDEVTSTRATLRLIQSGVGISLMPQGYRSQAGPDVRFVPVDGHDTTLQLAIPRRPTPPVARRFLNLVDELFPNRTAATEVPSAT